MKTFIVILFVLISSASSVNAIDRQESQKKKQKEQTAEIGKDSLSFLPEGTIIANRTKDRIYCFLSQDAEIQGILCRGDRNRGWETEFYTNGKLAKAWPARTEIIQGVPCMKASFWTELFKSDAAVYFYDNGKLAKCKLAKDTIIAGHTFKKGEHLRFDRAGGLIVGK